MAHDIDQARHVLAEMKRSVTDASYGEDIVAHQKLRGLLSLSAMEATAWRLIRCGLGEVVAIAQSDVRHAGRSDHRRLRKFAKSATR